MCKTFPYNWMRPFRLKYANYFDAACGYSETNTGYRLALACITVIGGALLIWYHKNEGTKVATYWGLFTCPFSGTLPRWLTSFVDPGNRGLHPELPEVQRLHHVRLRLVWHHHRGGCGYQCCAGCWLAGSLVMRCLRSRFCYRRQTILVFTGRGP